MGFFEETRELTTAEWDFGWEVFWDTIPYEDIRIGDKLGLKNCPWTQYIDNPGPFTGGIYILHMGPIAFPDCTSTAKMVHDNDEVRNTFIHELTHVWQGHHSFINTVFTESILSQACAGITGGDAYKYEPGLEWDDYNVEQQAKLVEDWYKKDKMSEGKVRYEYIRDVIRNC